MYLRVANREDHLQKPRAQDRPEDMMGKISRKEITASISRTE